MSFSNDARLINKDLGRIIAETTPSPKKKNKHCLPQTSWTWITRTGPRPSPVLYIHSLILESSELIYVKLQNVLMTPYDIETICGGLFDLKGKSSTGYESVHFSILSVIVHFCHWNWTSHSLSGDLRSCFAHGKEPEGRMLIIRSDAFDFAGKTGGVDLSKISPFHARRRDIVYFIIVISGRGG